MFATSAAIFSLLLAVTGVAKVARPHDVEKALLSVGLPKVPFVGTIVGMAEIAIAGAALFTATGLLLQGMLYLVFVVWVFAALRRKVPLASCGCLGRDDTPPSSGHLAMNVIATIVSLGAASSGPLALTAELEGITRVVLVIVGVFLAYIVLSDGARLAGVRAR